VLTSALEKNKGMFSPDGVFGQELLRGTTALLKALAEPGAAAPDLDGFIDSQWVGRRP
jgi:hypothetical protein